MSKVETVCPSCLAVNRLDDSRLRERPICGKCRRPLFKGKPLEVDDAGFQRLLQKEQLPMVVDFWAEWCGPCKMMAPVFAAVAAETEPKARFVKVDTERARQTASAYNIRSIPTLMAFRDGRAIAQRAGAIPPQELRQWLQQALSQ